MLKRTLWTGVSVLVLGAALAASPVHIASGGFGLAPAAFAKDGQDDGGGSGGGGDDHGGSSGSGGGGDDHGGSSGGGGGGSGGSGRGGDDGGSDDSGRGSDDRGSDDRGGDDRGDDGGNSGRGGDDRGGRGDDDSGGDRASGATGGIGRAAVRPSASASGLRVVKVERGAGGMEVTYSNGVREEIEAGRYQRKDAAGRTVVERPATEADLQRIGTNIRNSGLALRPVPPGDVSSVEVAAGSIEVRYATGWKEELAAGRYELKDPNDNTVVERPATAADRQRMQTLAGR